MYDSIILWKVMCLNVIKKKKYEKEELKIVGIFI